ncbi:MAG: D-alanine--D-alanine ligase [Deltaproteobacteria bacterium]|nr:D-alanine--D-alanine ligase [Deltaproteobacteria bacterium]MBI3293273.1 D-alanine--D-alanine ligase [Deltaproteobacteria bacterium]
MRKHVLILCGGRSEEHEISLISAKGILSALDRTRFEPVLVGLSRQGVWYLENEETYFEGPFRADRIKLNEKAPTVNLSPYSVGGQGLLTGEFGRVVFDVVFPILHGPFGEDGTIQGLFDIMAVPYVGSGCQSSAVCMDKELTKVLTQAHNIPGADFVMLSKETSLNRSALTHLGFPVFVKPARLGSSVGISKANTWPEVEAAVKVALQYDTKCLIEKGVKGREIECGVLGHTFQAKASLPGEIIPAPSVGWYSYEAKYLMNDGAKTRTPAHLDEGTVKRIQDLALKAFATLECEGMARVDMFLEDGTGKLYLNEVNTIPGFTPISMYPKMWEATGISYAQLITTLIELALSKKLS